MALGWAHVGATATAAFLASLVEGVEALTVVLAVGTVRGWRSALAGAGAGVAALLAIVAALGPALTLISLHWLQLGVGLLLLLFGMRWLRKAVLRSAGLIALHDEAAAFARRSAALRGTGVELEASPRAHGDLSGPASGLDKVGFGTAFNIVMLEGTEVVFIVIAIGAGGAGLLLPASLGALAALLLVTGLGFLLHRPLARVPENTLKFAVGVLLSAFGTFWVGEGLGVAWPGEDWSIVALLAGYLALALGMVAVCGRVSALPGEVR